MTFRDRHPKIVSWFDELISLLVCAVVFSPLWIATFIAITTGWTFTLKSRTLKRIRRRREKTR